MKKALKILAILVVSSFGALQFFRPDFTNPPVDHAEALQATTAVPENVQSILNRSCNDCHTNQTNYPWYSHIQPSAGFLKSHIDEGRRELNLSVWKTYEPRRQRRKLSEICEVVKAREMPLASYLWIHRSAKLSDQEIKTLCDWTLQASDNIIETK
jgi:hypothetical protein